MPIKPDDKAKYGPGWPELSTHIRYIRAGNRCEWIDEVTGQRCARANGQPIPGNERQRTVLTVAHLDHNPANNDPLNLLALCQLHHLRLDALQHASNARATRQAKKRRLQPPLFDA